MALHSKTVAAALVILSMGCAACLQAQERKVPKSAGEWNVLGMGLALQENWPEAVRTFQQAVQVQPSFVEARNNLGFALAAMGKPTEAVQAFQQAIRVKPDFATTYYNLGFTYETIGKWREAAEAFQQALSYAPGWDLPTYHLGYSDLQLGLWKDAAETFQRYLHPQAATSSAPEAGSRESQSDDPIQRGVLTFSVEPEKYITFANLAYAYQKQEKYSEAIATYRQSLGLQPDFADGHYSLAETYLLSGDRSEALEELAALQKLNVELAAKLRSLIDKSK